MDRSSHHRKQWVFADSRHPCPLATPNDKGPAEDGRPKLTSKQINGCDQPTTTATPIGRDQPAIAVIFTRVKRWRWPILRLYFFLGRKRKMWTLSPITTGSSTSAVTLAPLT